ncbi:MAG: AbrB family transcriptional regulator [Roseibium sp.]
MNSFTGKVTLSFLKSDAGRLLLTLLIAAVGGWSFSAFGLPAAWLSGGMVFTAAATLAGAPTIMPNRFRDGLFVLLGISMGAGVRPDVVNRISEWPVSMALLLIVVLAVTVAGYAVLRIIGKWPKETAFFGAIPGALSYVIALAADRQADLPRIASSQSVRLLFLVALLPYFLVSSGVGNPDSAEHVAKSTLLDFLIGFPLCLIGSLIAVKLRVPGGWLTGAFFMSAGLNASGQLTLILPDEFMALCFVAMGALIGCRFSETTVREFVSVLGASLAAFAAAFSVSVLGALLVSHLIDIPFGQALLAYAPGGLEVMTLLAFIMDLDPAFVAAHQIVRFTGMILLLPFITGLFLKQK